MASLDNMPPLVVVAATFSCLLIILMLVRGRNVNSLSLPLGPRGLPLVGNLFQMPASHPWIWFKQLGDQFQSPLVFLNLAGQPTIIINRMDDAMELVHAPPSRL
jgi:hypothetical protein